MYYIVVGHDTYLNYSFIKNFNFSIEELEEEHSQLKREYREKCREHEQLKRLCAKLKDDLAVTKAESEERDRLISEKGLVIVSEEVVSSEDGTIQPPKKALVSIENAQLLETAGDGSLGKNSLNIFYQHVIVICITCICLDERKRKPTLTSILVDRVIFSTLSSKF